MMGQVLQGGAGQAPARQAAIGGGLPVELPVGHDQQGLRLLDPRGRDRGLDDPGRRCAASSWPAGWSRCRTRRTLLKKARFGYRLGDGTLIDLMVHDGLTSTFDQRHMVEQASFVSRELGISREDQDAGRCAPTSARSKAMDEGRFDASSSRSARSPSTRAAPRHLAREARGAEAGIRPGGHDHGRQCARRQRRRGAPRGLRARSSREERGLEVLATIVSQGYVADEFAYLARTPAKRRHDRAREGREVDRGRRAGRAERGVLLGRAELDGGCSAPTRSG